MPNPELLLIFTFVVVVLLILVGAFVLRPFVSRLGDVMDRYLNQRSHEDREVRQLQAVREHLESLDQRMALMEERLEFTESLLTEERMTRALDDTGGREPERESARTDA